MFDVYFGVGLLRLKIPATNLDGFISSGPGVFLIGREVIIFFILEGKVREVVFDIV